MYEILRKVNINNEEYNQKVYGCRTKEEAEEKIKTYSEDGLFIEEYIPNRTDYIQHLKDKGYIIEGNKAILNDGELLNHTFLILHFERENDIVGYEEDYCLKMLSHVDLDGNFMQDALADENGNFLDKNGNLLEKNLDN